MHRKALCKAQDSDLTTDGEMMRTIKRERKVRKLEEEERKIK